MATVSLIVAAAENGVIGHQGRMPWRLPSDLKTFRRLTMGKPVVMGRKTFQSIGKALDGRRNIVVTRDAAFAAPDVTTAPSVEVAIQLAEAWCGTSEIMVIGGGEIYRAALPLATRIYLTRVHAQPEGDTTFLVPTGLGWREISISDIPRGEKDEFACSLVILERSAAG